MKQLFVFVFSAAMMLAQTRQIRVNQELYGSFSAASATYTRPFRAVSSAPTGACTVFDWAQLSTNGDIYRCPPGGSWELFAQGGGGGGAVSSVFGRTGTVVATSGDYTAAQVTNAVDSTATYSNPAWITALAYAKITGVPTFMLGSNNLSDLVSASTARTNLGLGSAATSEANAFEAAFAAGTTAQYRRADKTNQTLDTAAVPENTNLYFTNGRAVSALAGLYEVPLTFSGPLSRGGSTISCPTCLTGNQTITLSGDVSGSGTTAITATIGNATVTLAKMANLTALSLMGNVTGSAAPPVALSAASVKSFLAIAAGDVSGLAASATVDATNANNISTGTLDPARMSASYNAPTATQFVSAPAQCTSPQVAEGIQANGNANCVTPSGSSGSVPTRKDGTQIVASPVAHDFTGSGVTVANVGNVSTINVPGVTAGDGLVQAGTELSVGTVYPRRFDVSSLPAGCTAGRDFARRTSDNLQFLCGPADNQWFLIMDPARSITLTNVVDASGATRTAPAKKGTAAGIPATCTQGDVYFATDAQAGRNLYFCTATDTWTQQVAGYTPPTSSTAYALFPPLTTGTVQNNTFNSTTNRTNAFHWFVGNQVTVTRVSLAIGTTDASGFWAVSIWSDDTATKLIDTGAQATSTSGGRVATVTSTVLQPGWYWIAWTSNSTTATFTGAGTTANFPSIMNPSGGSAQMGVFADSSSGVFPGSLGSLTAGNVNMPFIRLGN